MTVSQYRTLAAMLQLRTFTAEQLMDATGVALTTIHTHINRMGGLESKKLPPTGPGAQRNIYILSEEKAAEIRERLLKDGIGPVSAHPTTEAIDAEEEDALGMPSALLAAELELLRCPPRDGDQTAIAHRLRRANAFLVVADRDVASRQGYSESVRSRFVVARALADLIGEELATSRASYQLNQGVVRTAEALATPLSPDTEIADLQKRISASPLTTSHAPALVALKDTTLAHSAQRFIKLLGGSTSTEHDPQKAVEQLTRIFGSRLWAIDNDDQVAHEPETLLFLLSWSEAESALESGADFETRGRAVQSFAETFVDLTSQGFEPNWNVVNRIRKSKRVWSYTRSLLDLVRSVQAQRQGITIVALDGGEAVLRITDRVSRVAEDSGAVAHVKSISEESAVTSAIRAIAVGARGGSRSGALPVVLATETGRGERERADEAVAAAAEVAPVVLLADTFDPYFSNLALKHHAVFVSMHEVDSDALVSALRLGKNRTPA